MDRSQLVWSCLEVLHKKYEDQPAAKKCFEELTQTLQIFEILPPKPFDFASGREEIVTLHISNLPAETTKEEITLLFRNYGKIKNITIVRKEKSSYGFVTFEHPDTALNVYKDKTLFRIKGQHISIHKAKQTTKTL